MIVIILLKILSVLCFFVSINSEIIDSNPVPRNSFENNEHKIREQNKSFANKQEYPMAPSEDELSGTEETEQEGKDQESESGVQNSPNTAQTGDTPNTQDNSAGALPTEQLSALLSSIIPIDPKIIEMFSDIMTRLVTNILPLFSEGPVFLEGLTSAITAMGLSKDVRNGLVSRSARYFHTMKSNPDSISPIMNKIVTQTLQTLKIKYENNQKKRLQKKRKPMKQIKQVHKPKPKKHG